MLDTIQLTADEQVDDHWSIAGAEFRRHLDDGIRQRSPGKVLPWERNVAVGQIDFWRVHAFALDRLDELLGTVLPDGDFTDNGTAWRGRHDERAHWIIVSLMTGEWFDPTASKRGNDLVGLIAHVYRMPRRRAAIRLARLLGIEAVRHG